MSPEGNSGAPPISQPLSAPYPRLPGGTSLCNLSRQEPWVGCCRQDTDGDECGNCSSRSCPAFPYFLWPFDEVGGSQRHEHPLHASRVSPTKSHSINSVGRGVREARIRVTWLVRQKPLLPWGCHGKAVHPPFTVPVLCGSRSRFRLDSASQGSSLQQRSN